MCCLFTVLVFLGPRFGVLLWWLVEPMRFSATFGDNWALPLLCLIFLPWTLLMYMVIAPVAGLTPGTDIQGFDWVWLGLAVFTDILSYTGGAYGNRKQIYAYVPAAADPSFAPPSETLPPPPIQPAPAAKPPTSSSGGSSGSSSGESSSGSGST